MTYDGARQSPNHSTRGTTAISMIVIHATAGSFASSLGWLCSPASGVSCHYLISKSGHVAQLVHDERAAWHAGKSAWGGRNSDQVQRGSVGIELENTNSGHDPYPPAQIDAARALCASLIARYDIRRADVVRHLDIAILPKGRKTDPAGFPWASFVSSLYAPLLAVPTMPPPEYNAARYRVVCRISTKSTGGPPWAGAIQAGELVEIDATYPSGFAHLRDGRGFVWLSDLEPAGKL